MEELDKEILKDIVTGTFPDEIFNGHYVQLWASRSSGSKIYIRFKNENAKFEDEQTLIVPISEYQTLFKQKQRKIRLKDILNVSKN